jgi:hypothetical protein
MTTLMIVWFRKYDQKQDFDGDEESSFSKIKPDKVFVFNSIHFIYSD